MASNIDTDTNFSNVVIANSDPVLSGGNWYASLDAEGKTIYTQGTTAPSSTYSGPVYSGSVNLVGANLTIGSGAVVDSILFIPGSSNGNPQIKIQAGGTLQNSEVFNSGVNIAQQGVSHDNQYVGAKVNLTGGGSADSYPSSINDNFYRPGVTAAGSGKLVVDGTTYTFNTTGNGAALTSSGSYTKVENPKFPNISANNPNASNALTFNYVVRPSSTMGAPYDREIPDYANYRISNDYPVLQGGAWTASVDANGQTVYWKSGSPNVTYTGPVNLVNISTLTIESGAVVDNMWQFGSGTNPTITIKSGGILQNSYLFNGTTNVQTGGQSKSNEYISQVLNVQSGGISSQDYFYEGSNSVSGSFTSTNPDYTGGSIAINTGDGGANINIANGGTFDGFHIKTGTSSNITVSIAGSGDATSCFLAGVLIDIAEGQSKVEDIKTGDLIKTYDWHNQSFVYKKVTWIGKANHTIDQNQPDDLAGYPVRVLKDAIATNIPSVDLLITPEHCLFFNNQFIPVRMLVNGSSIFYDHSFISYDYYHIKTEQHSVICANNVLTESFLDTKEQNDFVKAQDVVSIASGAQTWEKDAVAPLVVTRDVVEPIFRAIEARAIENNVVSRLPKVELSNDVIIHLMTDKGQILTKVRDNDNQFVFIVPSGVLSVYILSNNSRPSDVIGPFVDDRRHLGVLVGEIVLFDTQHTQKIDTHLTNSKLAGWHQIESNLYRWTKGNASLPLAYSDKQRVLCIKVVAANPYIKNIDDAIWDASQVLEQAS